MPEIIRLLTARLRDFLGNRRRAPRHSARLAFSLSIEEARAVAAANGNNRRLATINGHTCDLSATGLGLIVLAIRIGDQYLTGEARVLRVTLELPGAMIQVRVRPVRHEQMQGEGKTAF
ncbi:MAG: hypothetical protein WKF30_04685 [Pyrinomonadaceae bacterium]